MLSYTSVTSTVNRIYVNLGRFCAMQDSSIGLPPGDVIKPSRVFFWFKFDFVARRTAYGRLTPKVLARLNSYIEENYEMNIFKYLLAIPA